jgi:hypothetical protein
MLVCLWRRLFVLLAAFAICSGPLFILELDGAMPAATLPPLSGLAWLESNTFVAVHDAKNPEQIDQPRVSLLSLSKLPQGIMWRPITLDWPPPEGPSSDLESISRIPGTQIMLFAESGASRIRETETFARIFLCDFTDKRARIIASTRWPVPVMNVEGTAVTQVGDRLLFIFAERAEGMKSTTIRWSELALNPFKFGPFSGTELSLPAPKGNHARQINAIEVDLTGQIYVASTLDPGDQGPFQSVIWRVGRVELGEDNEPRVRLQPEPERLATLDGLKVEGIAVREMPGVETQFFVGTDDEIYGGALRPIPLAQ